MTIKNLKLKIQVEGSNLKSQNRKRKRTNSQEKWNKKYTEEIIKFQNSK